MEYDIPYPTYIPYIGPYNAPLGVKCQGRVVTCFKGCKNQLSHPRCHSWSLLHILPWFEAQLPIGPEYEPRESGHFGLIFDQNLPSFENRVLVRIELRGAIVELARKTKMT